MVLQEELVIFDLGNSCSNSSRKWYQYAHAAVEIIERKSFPKVTKQLNGVEGTGSQAQGCLIHSMLWTTVKAQCWRAATRQGEHQAGIRMHTRNSSKCRQLYRGQMGGGNGYQIAATVWAQLGCDAEKQKDWKEVWLQWWPLTSRIMCVHAHVCFLLDVSLHRMCKNNTSTLLWKTKLLSGPPSLPDMPYMKRVCLWLRVSQYSFLFVSFFQRSIYSLLFLPSLAWYKVDWEQMCVYLMKLLLKACHLTSSTPGLGLLLVHETANTLGPNSSRPSPNNASSRMSFSRLAALK